MQSQHMQLWAWAAHCHFGLREGHQRRPSAQHSPRQRSTAARPRQPTYCQGRFFEKHGVSPVLGGKGPEKGLGGRGCEQLHSRFHIHSTSRVPGPALTCSHPLHRSGDEGTGRFRSLPKVTLNCKEGGHVLPHRCCARRELIGTTPPTLMPAAPGNGRQCQRPPGMRSQRCTQGSSEILNSAETQHTMSVLA